MLLDFWGKYKKYGPESSTHDLFKTLAILFMIVDHIGLFFFPDDLSWRAVGRWCVPIWFFLAGYAQPRKMDYEIILLGILMVVACAAWNFPIFPVNALLAIIICRAFVVYYMEKRDYDEKDVVILFVILIIWAFILIHFFYYGSQALMFAAAGYLCRRYPGSKQAYVSIILAAAAFIIIQKLVFGFKANDVVLLAFGIITICCFLLRFKTEFFDWPRYVSIPMNFMGRNSLYIYFLHFPAMQAYDFYEKNKVWKLQLFSFS